MKKNIIRLVVIVALLLLIPFFANHRVEGWNWTTFDFIFMGVLLFGVGLAYLIISNRMSSTVYKVATGLACAATLLLIWVNAAVGIIGDGSTNALYWAIPLVGIIGAVIARSRPIGLSWTLVAMAVTQMLVPTAALFFFHPSFDPGVTQVFILNAGFAFIFLSSAALFRHAGTAQAMPLANSN